MGIKNLKELEEKPILKRANAARGTTDSEHSDEGIYLASLYAWLE